MIQFQPKVYLVDGPRMTATSEQIQNEPMLYGGTVDYIRKHKDRYPLTAKVLARITGQADWTRTVLEMAELGYHPVVDTKVVMLMAGQYPCIAGWHCDGVIRKDRDSQPDLATLNEDIMHLVCTMSDADDAEHCGTEFIVEPLHLKELPEGESVWGWVNQNIGDAKHIQRYTPEQGDVVMFNRSTLHRGLPAPVRQWRYFFRLSFYHMPAMNQERKQVQVYLDVNKGW